MVGTIALSFLVSKLTEEDAVKIAQGWLTNILTPTESFKLSHSGKSKSVEVADQPVLPRKVEFILLMFVRPEEEDALIGDLEERYSAKIKRYGKNAANTWLLKQLIFSIYSRLKGVITLNNLLAAALILKKITY